MEAEMKMYEFRGKRILANSKDEALRRVGLNAWSAKVRREVVKIEGYEKTGGKVNEGKRK